MKSIKVIAALAVLCLLTACNDTRRRADAGFSYRTARTAAENGASGTFKRKVFSDK